MALNFPTITYHQDIFCHIISVDPLIIVGFGSLGPMQPAITLSEALKDKKVYYIMGSWWTLQDPTEFTDAVYNYKKLTERYPNHNITYIVCDEIEKIMLDEFKIPCIFCHQNAFIDDKLFKIYPNTEKKFNAIYNARVDPFKRHLLAKKIDKVAFIYYNCSYGKGERYSKLIHRLLKNGIFLNDNPHTSSYKYLSTYEVCRHYNESRVGLCLSEKEGGMYVSTEYLLSGLPVVTTPNIGGRNFFFEDEYCQIAKPNSCAIRDAVLELSARDISPEKIRKKTLIKMLHQRKIFCNLIQSIYDKENVDRKFTDEWDTVFTHRLCHWIPNWQVISYIREHEGYKGAIKKMLVRDVNTPLPDNFVWI
ncbi:glycosyltransferase [Desulfolutivibrio sulfoxidireducens]|uniref:glycosyltransferase n=1 Tax=Desulfolutivibrio sulfoxidireducens TaxID=2773299 RepID=UPI00159DDE08|nr:glycosyltransferase [Desulfolutivibrio sulfoxidireducens]QLA16272.1 glycosyltransferase family 1 protein [Desulfolutivibrio sulfoxidireducens]